MLVASGGLRPLFDVLVAIHVLLAVGGFASLAIAGYYASRADRLADSKVLEETLRYFKARSSAEWLVALAPVPGLAAASIDPAGGGIAHPWIGIALVLWALAAYASLRVSLSQRVRLNAALSLIEGSSEAAATSGETNRDPSVPDADVLGAAGRAGAAMSKAIIVCDIVFVLALIDMVIKPG